jgi:hypothetical protein
VSHPRVREKVAAMYISTTFALNVFMKENLYCFALFKTILRKLGNLSKTFQATQSMVFPSLLGHSSSIFGQLAIFSHNHEAIPIFSPLSEMLSDERILKH